ncbi:DnaJ-class molecular chaperone [Allocatelliglobosispora scoriae]|uniref:DnaJ-class molecular chaperone n=1 Tax=Allocatelliglobosispora scoriae TaxID=643052 RepID=A0A841BXX1_9ACTN|nr:DnaJ-class molecular chaperone [Allocatelliglobosispora scoriae]
MDTFASLASTLTCPAIVVTLGYAALCAVSPYARCRRCHGTGHVKAFPRRSRPCGSCRTEGLKLRHGRRVANHLRRLHRDGTR